MKYSLNQIVKLVESNETGKVIARAEYLEMCFQYLIRYKSADGRLVEAWWSEPAIEAV
jgi:hypothetical protein